MSDVFISYAREDGEFVRRLADALEARGKEVWVDWSGILPSAEWMAEIRGGIAASDAFLFVISPDSADSDVCRKEIDYAGDLNKRIVPVLHREVDPERLPPAIAVRNWISFADGDFGAAVGRLVDDTLEMAEPADIRLHTRLSVQAAEWDGAARDASFHLHGMELREAEEWLARASARERPPLPSALQYELILASRAAATRRQRVVVAAVSAALVVSIVLGILALVQRNHAVSERKTAESRLLAIEAVSRLDARVDDGLRLSAAAYATRRTPEARDSVLAAVQRTRRVDGLLRVPRRVADASFAADGGLLAVATDRGPELWELRDGRLVASPGGSGAPSEHVALDPSGSLLASVGAGGRATVFDLRSGRRVGSPPAAGVLSAAFAPRGGTLALGTDDGGVVLWARDRGVLLRRAVGGGASVFGLAFAPDASAVAAATARGVVLVPVGCEACPSRLLAEPVLVQSVAWAGGRLAAVRADGRIVLWDAPAGGLPHGRVVEGGDARSVTAGPGGVLAAGNRDGAVVLLRGEAEPETLGRHGDEVLAVGFDSAGRALASVSADGLAVRWSVARDALRRVLPLGVAPLSDLVWTGGGRLAAAGFGRVVTVDAAGRERDLSGAPPGLVRIGLAAAPATGLLAAAGGQAMALWRGGRALGGGLHRAGDRPIAVAVPSDAAVVAGGTQHGTVDVWRPDTGATVARLRTGSRAPVGAVAFSPDGRLLAAGAGDGRVVVFDREDGDARRIVRRRGESVAALAFAPDGDLLAVADGDTVRIHDRSRRWAEVASSAHATAVTDLAFSPQGVLAASDEGGRIALWESSTRRPLGRPLDDGEATAAVAFRDDGSALAAGTESGRLLLWRREAWDPAAARARICRLLAAAGSAGPRVDPRCG